LLKTSAKSWSETAVCSKAEEVGLSKMEDGRTVAGSRVVEQTIDSSRDHRAKAGLPRAVVFFFSHVRSLHGNLDPGKETKQIVRRAF
jgi:hypothetical protein